VRRSTLVLRLYTKSSAGVSYESRTVANQSWDERTLPYFNAPSPLSTVMAASTRFATGVWVLRHAGGQRAVSGGSGRVSLVVTSDTAASAMVFASRDHGAATAPQLVITSTDMARSNTAAPRTSGARGRA
jgi:hypothetical protein